MVLQLKFFYQYLKSSKPNGESRWLEFFFTEAFNHICFCKNLKKINCDWLVEFQNMYVRFLLAIQIRLKLHKNCWISLCVLSEIRSGQNMGRTTRFKLAGEEYE